MQSKPGLFSNNTRYFLLATSLALLIISFGLELSRTVNRGTATATYNGATVSTTLDSATLAQTCIFPAWDGTSSTVQYDDNGNAYTIAYKVYCGFIPRTSAINYVAFVLTLIFAALFSRAGPLNKVSPIATIVAGGLAAVFLLTAFACQGADVNKGVQYSNLIKATEGPDAASGMSRGVHIASTVFTALTFLAVSLSTAYTALEYRRKLNTIVSPAAGGPTVRVAY